MKKKQLKKYLRQYAAKHGMAAVRAKSAAVRHPRRLRNAALQEAADSIRQAAQEFYGENEVLSTASSAQTIPAAPDRPAGQPETIRDGGLLRSRCIPETAAGLLQSRAGRACIRRTAEAAPSAYMPANAMRLRLPRLDLLRFLDSPYAPRLIELLRQKNEIFCEISAILDEVLAKREEFDEI